MCFGLKKKREEEEALFIAYDKQAAKEHGYDYLYRSCHTEKDFNRFYKIFYSDQEFWGGDVTTAFSGNLSYAISDVCAKFGRDQNNPFIIVVRNFLKTRPSPDIKINIEDHWKPLCKYIFLRPDKDDQFEYMTHLLPKFSDYKVFQTDYYGFKKFLDSLC